MQMYKLSLTAVFLSERTFGVEDFFELQKHISKLAHITDQLHNVVWVWGGYIRALGAHRAAFGGSARYPGAQASRAR